MDAIRNRDARRVALERLIETTPTEPIDRAALRHDLRTAVRDWRGLLEQSPEAGQRALRTLISDRLTFTPNSDARGLYCTLQERARSRQSSEAWMDLWGRIWRPHRESTRCRPRFLGGFRRRHDQQLSDRVCEGRRHYGLSGAGLNLWTEARHN